jgi:hypothetical protein
LLSPSSYTTQNQQHQMPRVSPHKNFQNFLNIPNSAHQDTRKSLSPNINQSNGLSQYTIQGEIKKPFNGFYSSNDIKRRVSLEKSSQYVNGLQQPQYNSPTNIMTSGSHLKVAIPDATVSYKQIEPQKLSPLRRVSGKLITTAITFQECVQLLHYFRLIYKTLIIMTKNLRNMNLKIVDTYSNWLLDILEEISDKIDTYVCF